MKLELPEDTVAFSYRGQLETLLVGKTLPWGVRRRFKRGDIDLFNSPRLQEVLRKDRLVKVLAEHEVPIPFTIHNSFASIFLFGLDNEGRYHQGTWIDKTDGYGSERSLNDRLCPDDNKFYVVKGIHSHNSSDILFVEKESIIVQGISPYRMAQEFIFPPFADGKTREYRFLFVNGEVVEVIPRQANMSLIDGTGDYVKEITSSYQFLTAWVLSDGLPEEFKRYHDVAREVAEQAYKVVRGNYMDQEVGRRFKYPQDTMDWACVDIILDHHGNPRVLEVDVNHDVSNPLILQGEKRENVFGPLADHIGDRHLLLVDVEDPQKMGGSTRGLLEFTLGDEYQARFGDSAITSQDAMFDYLREDLSGRVLVLLQ